jgi:hypothetical protein
MCESSAKAGIAKMDAALANFQGLTIGSEGRATASAAIFARQW